MKHWKLYKYAYILQESLAMTDKSYPPPCCNYLLLLYLSVTLYACAQRGINTPHLHIITPQLDSANCVLALTSRDGILWAQGIPNVKNRYRESIEMHFRLNKGCQRDKFVIRSVTDVLRTHSRFVKLWRVFGPHILQTYFGSEVRQ